MNLAADTVFSYITHVKIGINIPKMPTLSFSRLLHGDFHHDNILLGNNNEYKIIDPKGVIGDPIFDVARFILNEFYEDKNITYKYYRNHVGIVIDYFKGSLNIPSDILKKCLFIETVMANCWNVESNEEPDINSVIYAEAVMNNMEAI